jgi:predicted DNA-binding antitoxin AbrB/MazE fold protein
MSYQVDAIFDNGVLRPLVPLSLPDKAQVRLTVDVAPSPQQQSTELSADEAATVAKQKAALAKLRAEVDKLPQHRNNDGWSVVDHDRLLYDELQ